MEDPPPSSSIQLCPTSTISTGDMPQCPLSPQSLDQAGMPIDVLAQPPLDTGSPGSKQGGENTDPLASVGNVNSQPSSPLFVGDITTNDVDEIQERASQYQSDTEPDEPLVLVASGSSRWSYDLEKPLMVGAGLANLGNTCFLNAVLQCFSHSVILVQGLYSYAHAMPCSCNGQHFCLFCALWEHIDLSLSSIYKIITPHKFVDNLRYFSSSFWRYQQEDAHEFLQGFLDRLESSCDFLKAKYAPFSSQNDNLVKQIFGGRVVSKLRCCNCNHYSDTYEPSVDLSLEIDDANSLVTALDSFTKVEHLGDEDMKFTCENCKQMVSREKQLMLDQTPLVCALHLKRFKNDGSYVEKIDKHVEFPLELDLQPYTCGTQASNVDLKYDLYGIIVHATYTSTCGHYYCCIRYAPNTWYMFDDSKVTRVSEAYVISEEAYILFYTKQGSPWFSNVMETYKLITMNRNTSPKSVLDYYNSTSSDTSNNNIITDQSKSDASNYPESSNRSKYNRDDEVSKNNSVGVNTPPNYKINVQSNTGDYMCDFKDDENGVLKRSYHAGAKISSEIDDLLSPSTPPRSPGIDVSDDANKEAVFAAKANELQAVEKRGLKRQQNEDVDVFAKQEALKRCRKMPGARGRLLKAALDASVKSESSLHKRSKKMSSSFYPRKKRGHLKHRRRNLASYF